MLTLTPIEEAKGGSDRLANTGRHSHLVNIYASSIDLAFYGDIADRLGFVLLYFFFVQQDAYAQAFWNYPSASVHQEAVTPDAKTPPSMEV